MNPQTRYVVDFWGGTHGHFLEYVINCWIFRVPRVENLFTDLGACHGSRSSTEYLSSAMIRCGHYSQFHTQMPPLTEKIITISVDSFEERCCYQININHRAGDVPRSEKELYMDESVRNDPVALRLDYYSKYTDPELGQPVPQWSNAHLPTLNISMGELYDFASFFQCLNRIADFLEQTFMPDQELAQLWLEFVERNQGITAWDNCNEILKDVLCNKETEINLDAEQQALLNALLSRTVKLYDGELFENPVYPTNTRQIYDLVQKHLTSFDQRF